MDIFRLSPEALTRLTPQHLRQAVDRLTPEARACLTPEQVNAVMETVDPRYRLTPDERQRRDAARSLTAPDTWRMIVASCIDPIVRSRELDQLTFGDAVDIVKRISIGCWLPARIQLVGVIAILAPSVSTDQQRKPGDRRPRYPACIKSGTADLLLLLKKDNRRVRLTPDAYDVGGYDGGSPLIDEALRVLSIMRWFGDAPTPAGDTIADWVRTRKQEQLARGQTLPRGRPPPTIN